ANSAVIALVLKIANYTYGPLLGLFAFGLSTQRKPKGIWVPLVAIASPLICAALETASPRWLGGYQWGNELLVVNGAITYLGLWLSSLIPVPGTTPPPARSEHGTIAGKGETRDCCPRRAQPQG